MESILVTGGAGFIGSAFLRLVPLDTEILCVDRLTYAGRRENFSDLEKTRPFSFYQTDIRDQNAISEILKNKKPWAVVNFAAESHVDNSISSPQIFLETNILGVGSLLQASRDYHQSLPGDKKSQFRFLQVSTDEVFGELTAEDPAFEESTPYRPNSPYSASKAAADHLVQAWHHTYKLPTLITNCSNNYGPRQFPEKLIPRMILAALEEQALPVYGKGANIRDWIHVDDHARGVWLALTRGQIGQSYCFGGRSERTNLKVVETLCDLLDQIRPRANGISHRQLIQFVTDRAGHDFRYAINDNKARNELGFESQMANFEQGLRATLDWYLANPDWVKAVRRGV